MGLRIPAPILDDGPPMLLSGSVGLYAGRLLALRSQSGSAPLNLWSPWPVALLVICVVALALWIWRSVVRERASTARERREDETHTKIDAIHEMTTTLTAGKVNGAPAFQAATGSRPPRTITGIVKIEPGGFAATAIGVPSVTVTVPSGRQFGGDPDKPFEFTLPPGPQKVKLEDGGIVSITGPGYIAPDGTAVLNVNDMGKES